jgi:ADP-L-glycero-D-manno-heptose 6-epimerase
MKILLTGYKGFVGSHLLVNLISKGYDVSTYEWEEILPPINWFDWVIHVGAISSTTEKDVEKVMRQNVDFTIDLYEACRTFDVNFQFASSASVYGLNKEFKETSPVDPRTPYAWSKYLCERYILNNPMKPITQIFRYFNVYGPEGESHKGSQASPYYQFEKQARENRVIKVFENSENYHRDFIHVSEVIDYHSKFFDDKRSGVFNLGRGKTKSFLDVAKEVSRKYNARIEEIPMPEILKSSYQEYTCADMSKTNETKIY